MSWITYLAIYVFLMHVVQIENCSVFSAFTAICLIWLNLNGTFERSTPCMEAIIEQCALGMIKKGTCPPMLRRRNHDVSN